VYPSLPQAEQNRIWQTLCQRTAQEAEHYACRDWLAGRAKLTLPVRHVPSLAELNRALAAHTAWRCVYRDDTPWPEHFLHRVYPINSHLRASVEQTDVVQADLFHDVFGHLPWLTNAAYTDLLVSFTEAYSKANAEQREEIERLAWYTLEYGLVFEAGQVRAFGARLISCPREMQRVLRGDFHVHPFSIDNLSGRYRVRFQTRKTLFIADSLAVMQAELNTYFYQIICRSKCRWRDTCATPPDVCATLMGPVVEDRGETA